MNAQALLGWGVLIVLMWFMMRRGGCCGGATDAQGSRGGGGCCAGGHGTAQVGQHEGHGGARPGDGEAGGETAVDPVCGMTVQKGTALRATRDGQEFFFCSSACRDEFLKGKGDGHGGHAGHGAHGHCC